MRRFAPWAAGLTLVTVSACQTSTPTEPAPVAPPVANAFEPAQPMARIAADSARYANLFAPESYAVWVGPEVTAAKRAAAEEAGETIDPYLEQIAALINDNYYVFECRLESVFEDTSIAYDAVGLRGIDAYLITPTGYKAPPIQKLIGTPADESQEAALRRFGRTNILVFAKRDVLTNAAALPGAAPNARLVLAGHDSQYYFEWNSAGTGAPPPGPSRFDSAYASAKSNFNQFYGQLRTLAHVFD
jgi:hypothetical protein